MSISFLTVIQKAQDTVDFIAGAMRESTEYSIVCKDLEGRIVRWNDGAQRLYGYDEAEVLGVGHPADSISPDDVRTVEPNEILEAARSYGKWSGTRTRCRKNGDRFTEQAVVTPRCDAYGRTIGFLLISKKSSEDIGIAGGGKSDTSERSSFQDGNHQSDRGVTEVCGAAVQGDGPKILSQEQVYQRGLIDASLDGLASVDPSLVITDVNQAICELTGYLRNELIGSPFPELFKDASFAAESVMSALKTGAVSNYELALRRKSGPDATVLFNAMVFRDVEGNARGVFASVRDISDQERLRRELTAQQSYNRSLIEASADALFAIAPDGEITDVNAEATRLSGYTRKILLNSQFSTYFTNSTAAEATVRETLRQGRVIGYELMMITQQGKEIAVSVNAGVFTDTSGTNVGILAAARDITGQKRLEQQLRDQQFYTRSLIESNIDALMATDPQGIIIDANQQMEFLTGVSRAELIGSPFKMYFTDPTRAEDGIHRVLNEGKVTNYELTARAKDGKETFVSYNATTFNDRDGKLNGVFAAARDMTDRKRAEQHFRGLLESAPEAMVIVNQEGRIILVNSQTERLFGYDRQELLGQFVELLVPTRHQQHHPMNRKSYFKNPRVRAMNAGQELFARRKDGSEFPAEISLSPLETEDGILVSSSIRDVTERKHVELAIKLKNDELEKANQAKDRFLASMSHELRTPLNAIIGFTGTLLMELPGPLNVQQIDQLQTVERSANYLLSLINDLLDLAKIESGTVELNLVPVSCRSVIEEVIAATTNLAEQKKLRLYSEIPVEELTLFTDHRALTQILLNLTTNGLKFTERGSVCIRLKRQENVEGIITEISVADTGVGIRAEDQGSLFQAFYQVRGSGQAQQPGTGLGLHVSQKLANLLGGQIFFQSESGKGSTVTLVIKEKSHGGENPADR